MARSPPPTPSSSTLEAPPTLEQSISLAALPLSSPDQTRAEWKMGDMQEYATRELTKIAWLSSAALSLVAIYLLILVLKKRNNFKRLSEELGYATPPVGSVFLGHLKEYTSLKNQEEWHKRFGKIYGFYNCDRAHLRVSDLQTINEIFLKQSRNFDARTWNEYRLTPFNAGILFSHGVRWRRARRLFHPMLSIYRMTGAAGEDSQLNAKLLAGVNILLAHFRQLVERRPPALRLPNYAQINSKGFVVVRDSNSHTGYSLEVKAHGLMEVLTLDIILRISFDVHEVDVLMGLEAPLIKQIESWLKAFDYPLAQWATAVPLLRPIMPLMVVSNRDYRSYMNFMQKLFDTHNKQLIEQEQKQEQAEADKRPAGMFRSLVAEYRAQRMRKGEVIAHAGAIIVAGFETTATTTSYILWCIARYPDLKARLLDDILKDGYKSRYLDMFIKEVMRMYPALANFVIRSPKETTTVAGRLVKRGTSVYLGVSTVHYDAAIYPDPHKFDPERFAEGRTYPPGAYVPFGLGHRMCVGSHLAMREMKIIVTEVLRNFDIQLIAPQLELELESLTIFLTRSRDEILVRLIPRPAPDSAAQVVVSTTETTTNTTTSKSAARA